jgi:hypothetical protein
MIISKLSDSYFFNYASGSYIFALRIPNKYNLYNYINYK